MNRSRPWIAFLVVAAVFLGLGFLVRTLFTGEPVGDPSHHATPPVHTAKESPPAPQAAPAPADPGPSRVLEPKSSATPDHPSTVEAGPAGKILGRVVDPGRQPVAHATIELVEGPPVVLQLRALATRTGISAVTDAQGAFVLDAVAPADDYVVFASHPDYGDSEAGPIVVHASESATVADIVLRQGVHVQGYVTADGRAIESARVTLSNQMDALRRLRPGGAERSEPAELKKTTQTDAKGFFEFASVPVDSFELTAEAEGYARISKSTQNFLGGSPREQQIDFELSPAMSITGRVLDGNKTPIANVELTASIASPSFRCEQKATSDPAGAFTIQSLAKGQYFVVATCDGYTAAKRAQVEAGSVDVEIVMQVQGGVTGVVVDEETQDPVPDFELTVMQSFKGRGPAPGNVHQHFHDAGGRFELKNLDPGTFQIEGKASGYADSLSDEFQVTRGQSTGGVRVQMNRGGSVRGTVVDKAGEPVANALVILRQNKTKDNPISAIFQGMLGGDPEARVRTDAKGAFALDLIVPATYQVAVRSPKFAAFEQDDVNVSKGQVTDVGRLELKRGGSLRGKVFDWDGKPLGGAVVDATSKANDFLTVRCDAEGAFQMNSMPPGDYSVTVKQFTSNPPVNMFEAIIIANASRVAVTVSDDEESTVEIRLTRQPAPRKKEKEKDNR